MNKNCILSKLSEIAVVTQGQSPESRYYSNSEGTPFLQGNRTFGNLYPSFDVYTNKVTKLARVGDVLMSVRAPVGALNFAPCDLCIGRGLASIRAKNNNNRFIYYALKYNIRNLIKQGKATTFDSVNKDTINNFQLIIPSEESVQNSVSNLLTKIDNKIEINNKINSELENLAKTIYDYWFVQFDFPDDNGKPYKSSGGEMVWNEELKKEIPKGWKVQNLVENSLTALVKPGIKEFKNTKTYLATSEVQETNINLNAPKITFTNRESRANMQPISNSVWFAKMKNSKKILYFGKYSDKLLDELILSTGFAGLNCIEDYYLEYILNVINNDNFEISKDLLSNGATQQAINNESMKFIPLLVPSENVLKEFHKQTYNSYMKIYLNTIESHELAELRDFLLPLLMNGQVTIND